MGSIFHNEKSGIYYREYRLSDPLAEIVALLQPGAPYSKVVSGAGAWRVERAETGQPFYCVILEGASRLAVSGNEALLLQRGDFVLIPAAYSFSMSGLEKENETGIDPLTVTMLPAETRHGNPGGPVNARLLVGTSPSDRRMPRCWSR